MSTHVVLGSGGIGTATARELLSRGHDVVVASRSGRAEPPAGARSARVDAADAAALTGLVRRERAVSLVNAMNPSSYARWAQEWPPLAAAVLAAAEATGAGLVTVSNLYCYGRVERPMTEETPVRPNGAKGRIRAGMWDDSLAAHRAGRVRATELRASDYLGADARRGTSVLNDFVIRPAAAGRRVWLPVGRPDVLHTWTYLPDIARLAAVLATDDRSWGRAWHVPSPAPRTMRQVADDVTRVLGRPPVRVRPFPRPAAWAARVVPTVRELDETAHQFERPFVLDASAAEDAFALRPTPWEQALSETVTSLAPSRRDPSAGPRGRRVTAGRQGRAPSR